MLGQKWTICWGGTLISAVFRHAGGIFGRTTAVREIEPRQQRKTLDCQEQCSVTQEGSLLVSLTHLHTKKSSLFYYLFNLQTKRRDLLRPVRRLVITRRPTTVFAKKWCTKKKKKKKQLVKLFKSQNLITAPTLSIWQTSFFFSVCVIFTITFRTVM